LWITMQIRRQRDVNDNKGLMASIWVYTYKAENTCVPT